MELGKELLAVRLLEAVLQCGIVFVSLLGIRFFIIVVSPDLSLVIGI